MRISFQHANPTQGNESFLLRFDHGGDETPCLLVDAGHGVDVDALLTPRDHLIGICLTHAHLDHYAALNAAHRSEIPIVTSPATTAMLENVFDVADVEYGVTTTNTILDAITPITDWTTLAPNIEVHPVPAGHVPGAVGYLVRATDDDQSHHLLATGDFTRRRAAGYPGFDAAGFVDIDALFLTGATNDTFESALTDALGTVLEHAHGGAQTMLATSGVVGVHAAYLLAGLSREFDLRVPVRVVGQVAKLYDALDYDHSLVDSVPVFQHTDDCLEPGAIVIAGPEIPIERSSGRLFGVLREDPSACVVQLIGSGETPITDARCTIDDYELINHPQRSTLVEVHDAIDPTSTIITHRHGGANGAFNDLSSGVWGSGDTTEYTLYDGSHWLLPPWMGSSPIEQSRERSIQQFAGADLLASFSVPSIERHADPDLEAEGVNVANVKTHLHQGPDAAKSPDAPTHTDQPTTESPEPASMTANTPNNSPIDEDTTPTAVDLVQTTGPELADDPDSEVAAVLEEQGLTKNEYAAMLAIQKRLQDAETEPSDQTDQDGTPETSSGTVEQRDEKLDEAHESEPEDAPGESSSPETDSTADDSAPEPATRRVADPEPSSISDDDAASASTQATTEELDGHDIKSGVEGRAVDVSLHPLAVSLAERLARHSADGEPQPVAIDRVILDAVDSYLTALLAGDATGDEDERLAVTLDVSSHIEDGLQGLVDDSDRFKSLEELVTEGLVSVLGTERSDQRSVGGLAAYEHQLSAVAENDEYVFETIAEVVDAAIVWYSSHSGR